MANGKGETEAEAVAKAWEIVVPNRPRVRNHDIDLEPWDIRFYSVEETDRYIDALLAAAAEKSGLLVRSVTREAALLARIQDWERERANHGGSSRLRPVHAASRALARLWRFAEDVANHWANDVPQHRPSRTRKQECQLPPAGWACTRGAGHDGPCAGVVSEEIKERAVTKAGDSK